MSLLAPANLRTNYFVDPIGLDDPHPRFSWIMADDRRGARQSAYQLRVTNTEGVVWDTDQVQSDRSIQIPYDGLHLQPRQRYNWQVRIWDAAGERSDWSAPATFEMGLGKGAEWQGQWIATDLAGGDWEMAPAPYLRRTFTIDRPVVRARLYATALGLYEFHLNGRRVGHDYFTPGWTEYGTRVQYQTYDVTDLLQSGGNALGAILGDGWYCGFIGFRHRGRYGNRPQLLAQLMLDYEDGSTDVVTTDGRWKWSAGPILYSDIYKGESYDARRELTDWHQYDYDDAEWRPASQMDAPAIAIVASRGPRVRETEQIRPIDRHQLPNGAWIFNMGQNMVGWIRLRVSGAAGTEITLRHSEMLNPDGTLYTANLRQADATDHYTLKGDGEEIYEPRFTFHGFQYVELTGFPGEPTLDSITGIVLHSDTPPAGEFECSEPLVNQLQSNIVWGQRGNYLDIPTDCPQRDERLGWTGDAQVFIRTAAFNMDVAGFFNKWLVDLNDGQHPDGRYPDISPNLLDSDWYAQNGAPDGGVAAWADAGIICPWVVYLCYGDKQVLAEHYDNMKKWVDWQNANSPGKIRANEGYGDWLSIQADTPRDLIGTAFFAYTARLLSKIAGVLGHKEDAQTYQALFESVRRAFCNEFITPNGRIVGNTQTACLLALHFDLVPESQRPAVVDFLVNDIRARDTRLSCGFVGTPYLNHVLTGNGQLDLAYDLLQQTKWPSWLYAVTQGATTIWERWDGWTEENGFQDPGMNSFNHYAYGAIGEWLYHTVAGLDLDEREPAYKRIHIQPHPGGKLRYARAGLDSMYGRIESGWEIQGDDLVINALIPPNTSATFHIPAESIDQITESGRPVGTADDLTILGRERNRVRIEGGAGRYQFTISQWATNGTA